MPSIRIHPEPEYFDAISSRIVIAPVGSTIVNDEGEEMTLKKTNVGGIPSEGMFCDSRMLGWGSGSSRVEAGGAAPRRRRRGVFDTGGGGEGTFREEADEGGEEGFGGEEEGGEEEG